MDNNIIRVIVNNFYLGKGKHTSIPRSLRAFGCEHKKDNKYRYMK